MTGPAVPAIPASWTWGSSIRVLSRDNNMSPSLQLAAVTLPEPAVCTLYFQVAITQASTDPLATIRTYTVNLLQGIGRVTVPRQIVFDAQPAVGAPIEYTLPFMTIHALQVNVQQLAQNIVASPIETECYLILAPLTRVAEAPEGAPIDFGMALPGEADSLDHELVAELQEEGPTVAQVMAAEADVADQPDELVEVMSPEQAIVQDIVAHLRDRLGRAPTRPELKAAVQRVQDRMVRRGTRGMR